MATRSKPPATATPVPGDNVTLYTLPEAAPHLRISAVSVRRLESSGQWPRELFTWITGRVFMTGDQICRAIALCQNPAIEPPRGHKRPRGPKVATAAKSTRAQPGLPRARSRAVAS